MEGEAAESKENNYVDYMVDWKVGTAMEKKGDLGWGCQDGDGGGEKQLDILMILRWAGEEASSQR